MRIPLILSALAVSLVLHACGSSGNKQSGGGTPAPPGPPAPAPAPQTVATPIVSPLKYYNHFAFNQVYTLPVTIGGQSIESVLDTGSSNLLAIGDATHCANCVNEYGYNSIYTPGSQGKQLDYGWNMDFQPIGQATAQGFQDTVAFGGVTLPSFPFGLVTSEKGIPNIWGIAYPILAEGHGNGQVPLFDGMMAAARIPNQFSLRLCALKSGSNVTLGGFDSAVKQDQVQWTTILRKVWYSIAVAKMHMDSPDGTTPAWTFSPSASASLIVDSGTNPIVLPAGTIKGLTAVLAAAAAKAQVQLPATFWPTEAGEGGFATVAAADIAKFPPILLDIATAADPTKTFTVSVAPETYFQTREDGQRFIGIQPGPSTIILGTVFMENFVVLHDRGDPAVPDGDPTARVGFFPIAGLCN